MKNTQIRKTIEPTGDVCVKFTEDELKQLGISCGDKFSVDYCDDGIKLTKYSTIDIDLSEFPRELLEFIIAESNKLDLTISEYMEDVITNFVKNIDKNHKIES